MGKILYHPSLRGGDNVIDDSFLSELKINDGVKYYALKEIIISSQCIAAHINTIVIFILLFIHLLNSTISSQILLACLTAFILTSSGVNIYKGNFDYFFLFKRQFIKSSLILFLIILGFSTIFKTLTYDISLDSIWLISLSLLFFNIVMNNYSTKNGIGSNDIFSLNAGLFSGVCLSSRLEDNLKVFSFIILSFVIFAYIPLIDERSSHQFFLKFIISFSLSFCLSFWYYPRFTAFFVILQIIITLIIPIIYYKMQSMKRVISGPWDEASLT